MSILFSSEIFVGKLGVKWGNLRFEKEQQLLGVWKIHWHKEYSCTPHDDMISVFQFYEVGTKLKLWLRGGTGVGVQLEVRGIQ